MVIIKLIIIWFIWRVEEERNTHLFMNCIKDFIHDGVIGFSGDILALYLWLRYKNKQAKSHKLIRNFKLNFGISNPQSQKKII